MRIRPIISVLWVLMLGLAFPSWSQEDDLLVPLVPAGKAKTSSKPKVAKKPTKVAKPAKTRSRRTEDDLLVPLVPTDKAELSISLAGNVTGATLFLDGREMGKLPLPAMEVSPGEHSVSIRKTGYREFLKDLTVSAGRSVAVTAQLEPNGGVVRIVTNVEGADIYLGSERLGQTPMTERVMPVGTHELIARKAGYAEARQTVLVRQGSDIQLSLELTELSRVPAGKEGPLSVNLVPEGLANRDFSSTSAEVKEKPLHERWYVWAAAAAVVISGATYGILYATRGQTSLDPSRDVCKTGNCDLCLPASRCALSP